MDRCGREGRADMRGKAKKNWRKAKIGKETPSRAGDGDDDHVF